MSEQVLQESKQKIQKAVDFLHEEFAKLQMGRATTALVDSITVESFGATMPLKAVASISIPESNQIAIQPWNRDQLASIEKAIRESGLGFNPSNDGIMIRLTIPPLTEERRRDLVKIVHKYAEESRVSIRNSRHEALHKLKQMSLSEDDMKGMEKKIQTIVDEYNEKIEDAAKHKEKDILTI